MAGHRWRLRGDGGDLVLAPRSVGPEGHRALCTLREAEVWLARVLARSPAWSLRLRELDEAAREIARWHPTLRRTTPTETVRAALRSGVLVAYPTPSMASLPLQRDELETQADATIPLASDLIDRLYEKGIEFEDRVEDEDFGAIEEACAFEDEEFAGFEEETELEPEDLAGFEEETEQEPERFDRLVIEDDAPDVPVDGDESTDGPRAADGGATGARTSAPIEDAPIETESEHEDLAFERLEEESEIEEPPAGDHGASDPIDEPDAA